MGKKEKNWNIKGIILAIKVRNFLKREINRKSEELKNSRDAPGRNISTD